jgi:hypothetical protein
MIRREQIKAVSKLIYDIAAYVIPARFWRESSNPINKEYQQEAWMPDNSTRA